MNKELKKKIFLKRSELRKKIYDSIKEPKTATEIAKEIKKHRSSVSRVLLDLQKGGYARCVNPEDGNFRHYIKI